MESPVVKKIDFFMCHWAYMVGTRSGGSGNVLALAIVKVSAMHCGSMGIKHWQATVFIALLALLGF
jgi:nitrogen-specific signal transduction histidine kinase